jgi:hypothetical protein
MTPIQELEQRGDVAVDYLSTVNIDLDTGRVVGHSFSSGDWAGIKPTNHRHVRMHTNTPIRRVRVHHGWSTAREDYHLLEDLFRQAEEAHVMTPLTVSLEISQFA